MDLAANLLPNLTVVDPCGVASCHLTGDVRSLRRVLAHNPAFLTLKSTSQRHGGAGSGSRILRHLDAIGIDSAWYSFGPYELELLTVEHTVKLARVVKMVNPAVVLGASILCSEDFMRVAPPIEDAGVDFFEINFKYLVRENTALFHRDPAASLDQTLQDVITLAHAFSQATEKPFFLKLGRDLAWLGSISAMQRLTAALDPRRCGIILANSRRFVAPPDPRQPIGDPVALRGEQLYGSISGATLLPETLTLLKQFAQGTPAHLAASGGISSGYHALMTARLGAQAVQLCSGLQQRGLKALGAIRCELASELERGGYGSFQAAVKHWV